MVHPASYEKTQQVEPDVLAHPRTVIALIMPLAHERGGAETLFLNLLRHPGSRMRYVCAFLKDGPMVRQAIDLGYDVTVVPASRLRHAGRYIRAVHRLANWMRDKRPAIVVSWMLKAHLYAAPAAAIMATKTAWFQHGLVKTSAMDHLGAWLPTDAILCCSGYVKHLQDRLAPRGPSYVCYPGVELHGGVASRSAARLRLGLPANGGIVCMVARWERWKGTHVFLSAARMVAAANPNAVFFVVGGPHALDPHYADQLQKEVVGSDLHLRFRLVGQRPHEEIALWLASADIVVQPSIEPEPFGMALVEAMGSGRAVIASSMGGPAEIITSGVDGVLVQPDNPAALAVQILQLLKHPDARDRMAENAARRARRFSCEVFAARFEEIVRQACDARDAESTLRQAPLWA